MESSTATNSSFPARLLLVICCSCLTINDFAVQAEKVAVETSIDVGNILWIFYERGSLKFVNTRAFERGSQCRYLKKYFTLPDVDPVTAPIHCYASVMHLRILQCKAASAPKSQFSNILFTLEKRPFLKYGLVIEILNCFGLHVEQISLSHYQLRSAQMMHLVASIRLCVCVRALLFEPFDL